MVAEAEVGVALVDPLAASLCGAIQADVAAPRAREPGPSSASRNRARIGIQSYRRLA
jgi:hypothetical protein